MPFVFLCVWGLWEQTIVKLHCMKMASVNSSKSHRLLDFLPSIRPSFLSVVLLFTCGCLWMKNETTNGRLTALETRINMLPLEVLVKNGRSTENSVKRTTLKPSEESARHLLRKIQREMKFDDISGWDQDGTKTFTVPEFFKLSLFVGGNIFLFVKFCACWNQKFRICSFMMWLHVENSFSDWGGTGKA